MAKHPRQRETGALTVGLWLLAGAIAPAAQTIDYLPAVGAAPLLFQPPAAAGWPAWWSALPRPGDRGTNLTTLATNAPATIASAEASDSDLQSPLTVASLLPDLPPITADAPLPAPPPDPYQLSLPPMVEPPSVAISGIDMASVLRWLSPALTNTNTPNGSVVFPAFVPATPPLSSTAIYKSQ